MGYSYLTADKMLAQGSKPPTGVPLPFDVVVLAAREYQPSLPGHDVIHVPLDDSHPSELDQARIRSVAHQIAHDVRDGRSVLVTCHKGRNRSGVISGLALIELGVNPREAANRIRSLRNGLTNPHFMRMVMFAKSSSLLTKG